jgi:hypothetical protein
MIEAKGSGHLAGAGNWRIVTKFENGDEFDVALVDDH